MPAADPMNPYASPQSEDPRPAALPSRAGARTIVQKTLCILAVPLVINIWATFFWNAGMADLPANARWMMVAGNVLWFLFLFVALQAVGLWLIELPARMLHVLFGGNVSREAWMTSLHQSLWPMMPAALIGSLLWVFWLCLFHFAGHPGGFALDAVFQTAGHALGAWVYGNVLWHWYRLRRDTTGTPAVANGLGA